MAVLSCLPGIEISLSTTWGHAGPSLQEYPPLAVQTGHEPPQKLVLGVMTSEVFVEQPQPQPGQYLHLRFQCSAVMRQLFLNQGYNAVLVFTSKVDGLESYDGIIPKWRVPRWSDGTLPDVIYRDSRVLNASAGVVEVTCSIAPAAEVKKERGGEVKEQGVDGGVEQEDGRGGPLCVDFDAVPDMIVEVEDTTAYVLSRYPHLQPPFCKSENFCVERPANIR
jgi:hypothetical protein